MPSYTPIDYANAYFSSPTLPKIVGKPTYEKLRHMKKLLKANATSVQSDLGGGQFGHLGLVLDDATYNGLTGQNYVRPLHPGALVIPTGTAHHEAVRLREEHSENIRLFRETVDVQNALMKQIINTVENDYLKELYNDITSTITKTIPEVLDFLFTRYGEVDNQRVIREEDKVKNFTWNIVDPPVVLFNLIEDLETIAEAANAPKTVNQLINFGLDIIRATGEFEAALITWFVRPSAEHTWKNFKEHFTKAHNELIKVRGASMRGSAFHQANATVAALSSEIQNIKNDVVESINSLSLQINDEPFPPTESMPPLEDQQANATMSNQTALIAAIQELQAQIREMNDKRNINENRGQRRGGYNNRSGRDANRGRRNTSKYCWTHGACAHFSRDCSSPENGHKNEATFENKMGGSTAYCGGRN
jgi:hypothetical protein